MLQKTHFSAYHFELPLKCFKVIILKEKRTKNLEKRLHFFINHKCFAFKETDFFLFSSRFVCFDFISSHHRPYRTGNKLGYLFAQINEIGYHWTHVLMQINNKNSHNNPKTPSIYIKLKQFFHFCLTHKTNGAFKKTKMHQICLFILKWKMHFDFYLKIMERNQ